MDSLARRELFSATPATSARAFGSTASPVNKEKDAVKVSAILGEIGLPDAKCEHYRNHDGRVGATCVFWPSLLHLSKSDGPTRIHGNPTRDIDEAVQNAATECLKYIEGNMKIEFECPAIKKMKDEMKRLSNNIDDKDWTIRSL